MSKIKDWSNHIIRHFWYCSSVCKVSATTSDEEALKIMKVNVYVPCHYLYLLWERLKIFKCYWSIWTLTGCIPAYTSCSPINVLEEINASLWHYLSSNDKLSLKSFQLKGPQTDFATYAWDWYYATLTSKGIIHVYNQYTVLFFFFTHKGKWIGLLHHVCNKHEWDLNGKCDHEEGSHEENLPWFDRRDADFIELQKIVLNPELLESFK